MIGGTLAASALLPSPRDQHGLVKTSAPVSVSFGEFSDANEVIAIRIIKDCALRMRCCSRDVRGQFGD